MSVSNVCQGILFLVVKDKVVLYSVYMLFVKNGGIFVFMFKCYFLGDEVFLLLILFDFSECLLVVGKVIWVILVGVQGNCIVGIGVQLVDGVEGEGVCYKIEILLVGLIGLDKLIYMM